MKKPLLEEILQKNPQLDMARVAQMEAFRAAAVAAGIDVTSAYRVAPPLGELVRQSNQRLLRQKP